MFVFFVSEMGFKKSAFKLISCRTRYADHFLSPQPFSYQNFTVFFGVINMAKFANAPPQIGPQLNHTSGSTPFGGKGVTPLPVASVPGGV